MNIFNDLTPIKIILTLFALFAWSRSVLVFYNKRINLKEFIFWSFVWFFATIIVFIPKKSDVLAHYLGMGRGFDALVFIAVVTLFYTVYRLYTKANENEKIITDLIRQIALRNAKKPKNK